jgi:hypothetical protein
MAKRIALAFSSPDIRNAGDTRRTSTPNFMKAGRENGPSVRAHHTHTQSDIAASGNAVDRRRIRSDHTPTHHPLMKEDIMKTVQLADRSYRRLSAYAKIAKISTERAINDACKE